MFGNFRLKQNSPSQVLLVNKWGIRGLYVFWLGEVCNIRPTVDHVMEVAACFDGSKIATGVLVLCSVVGLRLFPHGNANVTIGRRFNLVNF